MQAQKTRAATQAITSTQSLAAVQTLLKAGLGCITFLRNLLPDDNFTESHFTTSDETLPYESPDTSFSSSDNNGKRHVNGFKIMTITRGHTDEADRILNYLEYGIFDALQKQYLRSFIFAVYLDSKDPSNIIEAYTFNFQYHTLPGTNTVVPIMTLGDGLKNMNLRGTNRDPVAEAACKGRTPTLKEVKRSVKALLKTLIHAMGQMDDLPKHRYATFKVFYTDSTPADYEPLHFQTGDAEKDKWFFMTHDLDEVPDKWSVGNLNTGHHSVNLTVTSIATYLPSSTEHENAPFTGTTTRHVAQPILSPVEEARDRVQQAEKQIQDAENRNVVWAAEDDIDVDAYGDDDPDYERLPDGTYVKQVTSRLDISTVAALVGLRNKLGVIEPIGDETHYVGFSEGVPTRLKEINLEEADNHINIDETQPLFENTQVPGPPPMEPVNDPISTSSERSSPLDSFRFTDPTTPLDRSSYSISPGLEDDLHAKDFQKLSLNAVGIDSEMLDVETQVITDTEIMDSIQSCEEPNAADMIEDSVTPKKKKTKPEIVDRGLDCYCGISSEEDSCFCEGGCGKWFHLWCMGFHSIQDERIPSEFICFDCRVRADLFWELIQVDLYSTMISNYKKLAIFRRAIKIAETHNPESVAAFVTSFGGENALARSLFKRLETEGFIVEKSKNIEDFGLTETRTSKSRGKQMKPRKNVQKFRYVFNYLIQATLEYSSYFNPDQNAENKMLGLADFTNFRARATPVSTTMALKKTVCHNGLPIESQTQDETQMGEEDEDVGIKRTCALGDQESASRPKKKVKISVATGVDLAE